MAQIRLNKVIADSGLTSRRKADELIQEGLVTVNGKKVYELGVKVDPENDQISVEGKPLKRKFTKMYLMFNKPKGVLTTMDDPLDRPTIAEYLTTVPARVFPVGRLDWDSEGLLLLTNDGDWANEIAHPKKEVTKTYLAKLSGNPKQEHLDKLIRGISIVGGKVYAKHVEKIKKGDSKDNTWVKIVITEGKNRQIRLMFEKLGFDVLKLQRVAIGRLRIGNLERGQLVYLNDAAAARVFLQDLPDEAEAKKGYKGRHTGNNSDPSAPEAAPKPKEAQRRGKTSSKKIDYKEQSRKNKSEFAMNKPKSKKADYRASRKASYPTRRATEFDVTESGESRMPEKSFDRSDKRPGKPQRKSKDSRKSY